MATYFTTTPTSLTGNVYSTKFAHSLTNPYDYSVWQLGDGTYYYNQQTVEHSYDYPGTYQVSVTAGNYEGSSILDETSVEVDFVYRDAIIFTQTPSEFGLASRETSVPFVVSLTSSKIDEPISVCLYAYNSRSAPHFSVPEKWNFIVPKWKFIDSETKEQFGDSVLIQTQPLYKDSVVVGVSGQLSFYYIDDSSTGLGTEDESPILLVATLSTENFSYPPESKYYKYKSYSNPIATKASIVWHVNDCPINGYKITENYLNEIYSIKWKDVPIPVMITCTYTSENSEGVEITSDVLGYPRTNEIGLLNPIDLKLFENGTQVLSSLYEVERPLYFKANDENGNQSSGYIFTTVTPLTTFSGNMTLGININSINTVVPLEGAFGFPYGFPIYANVFVNNILHSNINIISIDNYSFSSYESQDFGVYLSEVQSLTSFNSSFNEISGTAATYGLAFNPILNCLYVLDADQDSLTKFNNPYQTVTASILLSAVTNFFPSVPSYVSIDGNHDLWVSMFNTHQLLKFDKNLNYLLSAAPTMSVPYDSLNEGSPLVEASIVETDQDNNLWASYCHPTSSLLVKFDDQGNELFKATNLPSDSIPVSLAIDPNKNVWTCCYNTNVVNLYSSTDGQLLSSIDNNFIHPTYIALDREANVWFTHGYNFCSKYDIRTNELSTWKFANGFETITRHDGPYTSTEEYEALHENEIWGGLSIDVYNRVWIVDKVANKVAVFLNGNPANMFKTDLTPSVSQQEASSAQSGGDWTGNRWYQKYAVVEQPAISLSAPFKVYDINHFQLAKVNETFDGADYMKSLALPEILSKNLNLFDEFFKALVGDEIITEESMGRVTYERIANFLQNHADVETAEIKQLLSLADQLKVTPKTFGFDFPVAINRLLNIFSVPKHRLRGTPTFNEDFEDNVKELLTLTSLVSSNEILAAKDRIYNKYHLIVVSPLGGLDVYPLSMMEVPQLRPPLHDNYYFFRYEEEPVGYKGNVIDWTSDQTTVSYTLSTSQEWYGDEGLADIMFNSLLTKQLFLE